MDQLLPIVAGGLLASGGVAVAIVTWARYRKKDSADVRKTKVETDAILIDNFEKMMTIYKNENKLLQATVNELKRQVMKLEEQVKKFNHG